MSSFKQLDLAWGIAQGKRAARLLVGPSALKMSEAIMAIAISALMVRLMSIDDFGRFSFLFAMARIMTFPARQGLSQLMVKEIARERPLGRFGPIRGLIRWASLFALAWLVPATAGVYGIYLLAGLSSGELVILGILVACAMFCVAGPFAGYMRGFRKPSLSIFQKSLLGPLVFLGLLTAAWIEGLEFSVSEALVYRGLPVIGAVVLAWLIARRRLDRETSSAPAEMAARRWTGMLVPFTLVASAMLLNQQIGLVLAGLLFGPADVAIYRVADQFAFVVTFVPTIIGYVATPVIAEKAQNAASAETRKLIRRLMAVSFTVTLALLALLVVFGPAILSALYGPSFAASNLVLLILAAARGLNAGTTFNLTYLNMRGDQKPLLMAIALSLATQVALGVVLGESMGLTGLALAAAAGLVLNAVLIVWQSQRSLAATAD